MNKLTSRKIKISNLSDKQTEAVLNESKRLLLLAGAGSGKTKTLLNKINYLIVNKGISPNSILAITFTKNAANEMIDRLLISADSTGEYEQTLLHGGISKAEKNKQRLNQLNNYKWIDRLTIKTFHGFCFSILNDHGVKEFDNKFKIISSKKREDDEFSSRTASETIFEATHKILVELCLESDFLLQLKRYILDYVIDKIHLQKDQPPPKDGKFYTSLGGTRVRSKSEQSIANWFYAHNITYEYEPLINIKDFDFRPDFFIPEANLFIEHVSDKSHPTRNKEQQFKKGNFLYVKTFESMTENSAVLNQTLDKIVKNRLQSYNKQARSLNYNEEFNGYHENIKDFVKQIIQINDMIKVDNMDLEKILEEGKKDQHERIRSFYYLAGPIIKKYEDYCIDKSYLDFNDLILRSISLFQKAKDILTLYKTKYQYILIDEFQDVNSLQVDLIKLLLTDQTQLFCVGDDWQSVYGFRGANVGHVVDFEKHFSNAKVLKLDLNYRSTQNIVKASNDVIKHNQFKVDKVITSSRRSKEKVVVYVGNSEEENVRYCADKVKALLKEGLDGEDILFLYRIRKMRVPYLDYFDKEDIHVQFKTIHGAKGLEAKAVFILGLTCGTGGFPDIWSEDRIYTIIKKPNYDLLLEEERRLFYVSITRAKDRLFLITEKGNESRFLKEISEEVLDRTHLQSKSI